MNRLGLFGGIKIRLGSSHAQITTSSIRFLSSLDNLSFNEFRYLNRFVVF
jgi:hypothetical protein